MDTARDEGGTHPLYLLWRTTPVYLFAPVPLKDLINVPLPNSSAPFRPACHSAASMSAWILQRSSGHRTPGASSAAHGMRRSPPMLLQIVIPRPASRAERLSVGRPAPLRSPTTSCQSPPHRMAPLPTSKKTSLLTVGQRPISSLPCVVVRMARLPVSCKGTSWVPCKDDFGFRHGRRSVTTRCSGPLPGA